MLEIKAKQKLLIESTEHKQRKKTILIMSNAIKIEDVKKINSKLKESIRKATN